MSNNSKKRDAGCVLRASASGRTRHGRAAMLTAVIAAAMTAAVTGCSTASSTATRPPTWKLVHARGSSQPSIALTQLGAERIGLETASVTAAWNGEVTFPYTALLYEPNGQAAVYVATGWLTFTRAFVTVDSITGDTVTVTSGIRPGHRVATDGAEELLGVQNGVGEET